MRLESRICYMTQLWASGIGMWKHIYIMEKFSGTYSLESRFWLYPLHLTILTGIKPLVSKLRGLKCKLYKTSGMFL